MAHISLFSLLLAFYAAVCSTLLVQKAGAQNPSEGGTYGVDVSTLLSVEDFQCLKSMGFNFAIIRAYRSIGRPSDSSYTYIRMSRTKPGTRRSYDRTYRALSGPRAVNPIRLEGVSAQIDI